MPNLSKQEKIEAIRKECIRVNPEIMELKFGCITEKGIIVGTHWSAILNEYEYVLRPHHIDCLPERLVADCLGEIIGRPIGLADVLLAIPKWSNEKMESLAILGFNYGNPNVVLIMDSKHTHPRAEWNLLKPLEDQEESTIDFIHDVLKV